MTDNPNVRNHHLCPLCDGPKDVGLVACWPCFRSSGLKYGDAAAERKLTERESQLRCARMFQAGRAGFRTAIPALVAFCLVLATASGARADTVCQPLPNGGFRCWETGPHGCEWQIGGCPR